MRYTNINWIWISLLFFCAVLFKGCTDKKKEKWETYTENFVKDHVGKHFSFPDSAIFIPNMEAKFDSVKHLPYKIVLNIDIDCGVCLNKFDYWRNFKYWVDSVYQISIPILVYVNSTEKSEEIIRKNVEIYWNSLWAYDKKYELIDKNNLIDERFQAVLLDENNIVKIVGNPFLNEAMDKLYKDYIKSIYNEKNQLPEK